MTQMRPILFAALTALAGVLSAPASADEKPLVVLELFTSQGCSNCPPADALVAELAGRDDVLPLALHVDYWDYIGWPDSFARAENTARQKAYARAAGQRSIYTPEMVIGGVDHIVGYKPMQVVDLIRAHAARIEPVDLDAEIENGVLRIIFARRTGSSLPAQMALSLVSFIPEATVTIRKGENAGETITYANIVTNWQRIALWDGAEDLAVSAEIPADHAGPLALILQETGPGRVISAVMVRR